MVSFSFAMTRFYLAEVTGRRVRGVGGWFFLVHRGDVAIWRLK